MTTPIQPYLSNKIECWVFLKNNRITKKLVPYETKEFNLRNHGSTYMMGDNYYIRTFKLLFFIPINRLCLFYSEDSPMPIIIGNDGKINPNHMTAIQVTEILKQGGHYAKMLQETPFDIMMQKIQFYGIMGCLAISVFVALKLFGVLKI